MEQKYKIIQIDKTYKDDTFISDSLPLSRDDHSLNLINLENLKSIKPGSDSFTPVAE